jgi:hypothetical protein
VICLRMMTDQCAAGLEDTLNSLFPKRIKAISTLDLEGVQNLTHDSTLIEKGIENEYILLTRDVATIKRKQTPFKPCTHYGIVKLIGMPNDYEATERLRKLLLAGPRYVKEIKGHFTHLRADGATIYKKDNVQVEVPFR